RLDRAEPNVKSVSEHQRLTRAKMRLDRILIDFLLLRVGRQNHDHVGPRGDFRRRSDSQSFLLCLGEGAAARLKSNAYLDAAIAQVQCMGVPLRAVTNDS